MNNVDVKQTKVPFSIDEMREYFLDKNKFFIIDYKNSELHGNRFLSYVGNLEIPFELNYQGMTKEQKFELLNEFFKSRTIIKFDSLALTAAEVLLASRKIDDTNFVTNSILTLEEKLEFISENEETIHRWNTFLLSTNIFMLTTVAELNEQYHIKECYPQIIDPQYLGQNVVQMFAVPGFMERFFSVPADREIFYFKHQFEDYIYKGKNLYSYFRNPENTPFIIFEGMMNGTFTPEHFLSLREIK
jgi:hypothetical protein